MSYFITGTDTDVGKTLVSCALLHGYAAQGRRVVGMKPVAAGGALLSNGAHTGVLLAGAAGCAEGGVNDDVLRLRAACNVSAGDELVNPYSFAPAIAPHLAAQRAGVAIDTARIVGAYGELAALADVVIVEGAGGFMVPLNDTQTGADLALQLSLPVIVVVGMRLGCLNHALLTLRAIEACGLQCAGWVANVVDAEMPALQENIATLRQRIDAPLLGVVPFMAEPDAKRAAGFLDLGLLGLGA